MEVRIVNQSNHELPAYKTQAAAGMDISADLEEPLTLDPLERTLVPTGLYVELPPGFEAQLRPRSGLAYEHGITLLNTPGTIDADYRGELKVLLANLSNTPFRIEDGERIAQMVISKHEQVNWKEVRTLADTERGEGGFGHTGR